MVNYVCETCNKEFKKKSHLDDHINKRKKPCKPSPANLPQNPSNLPQNPSKLPKKTPIPKYMCNFCEKTFTRSDHLKIHLIDRCKIKKEDTKNKEEIYQQLMKNYELLEKQNEMLAKRVEFLEKKTNKTKTINNGTINSTINNGTINNNTINIIQHGKEDLSKIENNVFLNALLKYTGAQIPSKIIEGIHFNNAHPEFKNIYISDINREKVMLHNGKEWLLSLSNDITSTLLDKSINFSENRYEELEEKINDKSKKKLTKEIKMMEMMKEFDELEFVFNSDTDDEGKQLSPKDIERRKYLRLKAEEYIKLLLYNKKSVDF